MSLSLALDSALSGLIAAQRQTALASRNIANANTPGYVRKDAELASQTVQGEGRAFQWGFFMHNDVEPPMLQVFHNRVQLPPEKRNPALADEGEARLQPKLAVLEGALTDAPYFGGDRWDMSDFMVASMAYTMSAMKLDLSKYPRFEAWLAASQERPAFKEAFKLRA